MKISKYLFLSNIIITPLILHSCNVRHVQDKYTYTKSFNHPNVNLNYQNINKVKRVETDFESLLHSPLISWKFDNKAKYDNNNHQFYESTNKYLTFGLANKIIIKTFDNTFIFDRDNVNYNNLNNSSDNGIIRINSNDNRNINSLFFIEKLHEAQQIIFELKTSFYVNSLGENTQEIIKPEDYWNSFENDWENLINLLSEYQIKAPEKDDFLNSVVFNIKNNNENIINFILNEITTNMIFNPLSKKDLSNVNKLLFSSPYILNTNTINQQIFIKNSFYPKNDFIFNNSNLKKIILNYNSLPLDENTFNFQQHQSFKQNLISEVNYDDFNKNIQNEIDKNPLIYGLTFNNPNISNSFGNKIFINFEINKELIDTKFAYIFYGNALYDDLHNDDFFSEERIAFRNLFFNILNPFTIVNQLNKSNYWISKVPENMQLKKYLTIDLKDNLNFNNIILWKENSLIKISEFDYKKHFENNFNNFYNAFKSPYFNKIKSNLNKLIDYFYDKYHWNNNEKININMPIFEKENSKIKKIYKDVEKIINDIDNRLNIKFIFVDQNDTKYFLKYQNQISSNYNFEIFAINLLFNQNYLVELLQQIKKGKNEALNQNFVEIILKIKNIINLIDKNILNKKQYLTNIDKEKIISIKYKIQEKLKDLTLDEQINTIKAFDFYLLNPFSTSNFQQLSHSNKQIVQIHFNKPLNDLGYTQYFDILVL
ncbi:OppA family ABC transporter substrate-binding lipoprotein [Mycoplasma sp. 1018B]|uniref:OppA family ABC transporter substrate-binding lipoprotein n=1 Tax=Mycoplasma sp. 1018B TaxID=2967302 RepID=UPI00211BEF13|nr:hypothetical protein [Mycoplasma sp. 1018B]UUM19274.1 hypothetical protein NPA14_00105 [Mycoplasma sp. 1018B]